MVARCHSELERQAKEVFLRALEMDGSEARAESLRRNCGANSELRARVEALLTRNIQDSFLENPAAVVIGSNLPPAPPAIDRYTVVSKIAEGGCGVVYLAQQLQPVRRRVALKIIKAGMDSASVIARFEAERQALALMDHPNIAKVFEAGATESGRPYFVMELVQGKKITDYCSEHKLAINDRLNLFLQVCDAVQHAHQKGIIHRDLKPSNILVTEKNNAPCAQVIDFGIAKAIQGKLTDETIHTGLNQFLGTPAYMSPEQADLSPDIDTRTDIYSLGVLLYELLTGKPPFDNHELLTAGLDEMRRIIRDVEPVRPSQFSVATPQSLIPSDLDWIAIKCLEKDRSRRYETASALAADIQRHLNNEPVIARPGGGAYRFKKFILRHRTASTAIGVAAGLILLGTAMVTWAFVREQRARRGESAARAQEQAALTLANERLNAALGYVNQLITNIGPEIAYVEGAAGAQKKLLDANLVLMQQLRDTAGDDEASRLVLARLLLYMSEVQNPGQPNTTGGYELALNHAEEATALLRAGSSRLSEEERLTLLYRAQSTAVQSLYGLGRYDEGILCSKQIEPVLDELERFPLSLPGARRNRMLIQYNAGWATYLAGRPTEALTNHVLPILASGWAQSLTDNSPENELHLLVIANDLASNAFALQKQFNRMLGYAAESLRLAELLAQRPDKKVFYTDCIPQARAWHALALLLTGETDRATAEFESARADIHSRVEKQQSSESFRRHRVITVAVQALAYANWSQDLTPTTAERRERLNKAEGYLAEAEELAQTLTSGTGALREAVAEVAAAKTALNAFDRAPSSVAVPAQPP